jgi:hypothetical protein
MFCGSSGGGCFSTCFDSEAELVEVLGELCACKLEMQKRGIAADKRSLIIGFPLLLLIPRCFPAASTVIGFAGQAASPARSEGAAIGAVALHLKKPPLARH